VTETNTDAQLAQLLKTTSHFLYENAGGYAKNVVWVPGVTCDLCATPLDYPGTSLCTSCSRHRSQWGDLACSRVGFMIYGIGGEQSGTLLRGYKSVLPGPSHTKIMSGLCQTGSLGHRECVMKLTGHRPTHWSTVPSLPHTGKAHPLKAIMNVLIAPGHELILMGAASVQSPRNADPAHFVHVGEMPPEAHVLLIDDTWSSGGHAQSAAMALRLAGATSVSILCIGRWINPEWGPNKPFLAERIGYNPYVCPWTGAGCP
jgi:hypothetical protein